MKRTVIAVVTLLLTISAAAEESSSPPEFTLASGVTLVEQVRLPEVRPQSFQLRKTKSGVEVRLITAMPCRGKIQEPWLSLEAGKKASLVIEKVRTDSLFNTKEECGYRLLISIDSNRLKSKETLYVVNEGVVVGHAVVP